MINESLVARRSEFPNFPNAGGKEQSLDLIKGHQPAGAREHVTGLSVAIKMALAALARSTVPMT